MHTGGIRASRIDPTFGEPTSPYHVTHRVGILTASALAAGVGWTLLLPATRRPPSGEPRVTTDVVLPETRTR